MDYNRYEYASRRNVVFARGGMANSTSPIASGIGADVMRRGGNAVDAALAMAMTMPLVEPTSNGLGSDCFVLVWMADETEGERTAADRKRGRLYGLNGSGHAPMALNGDLVRSLGYEEMPINGWIPTMVPGAPGAWAELARRFGTMSLSELAAPAVKHAREGFNIPVNVAKMWKSEFERFEKAAEEAHVGTSDVSTGIAKNASVAGKSKSVSAAGKSKSVSVAKDANSAGAAGKSKSVGAAKDAISAGAAGIFDEWLRIFGRKGEAYVAGDVFCNPDFADTLEEIAATNAESFYRGDIMKKIVAHSEATGGYFSEADFKGYSPEWVEPIHIDYKGYDVYEMPPNGHGITALMALNILKDYDVPGRDEPVTYHRMIEAIKLAYADTRTYVADPRYMKTRVEDMLSDRYAAERRGLIGDEALMPEAGDPACGGTVYFCTADGQGNMVSFIQSNYQEFGSGIVIPGTGISLQDRGANFSLDPASDNYLEGGKKSYHTIIPGFLGKDGEAIGPFGVMGGFMQPQGHVQVVVNTVDYGMNPQEALDCPRFQWVGDKKVQLEQEVPVHVRDTLASMGHEVEVMDSRLTMGRGQIIWRMDNGSLVGGTEPRADGSIAAL